MALHDTQIALGLAKSVIEQRNPPADPEVAAKEAVLIYTTILNSLPAPKPKPVQKLPL